MDPAGPSHLFSPSSVATWPRGASSCCLQFHRVQCPLSLWCMFSHIHAGCSSRVSMMMVQQGAPTVRCSAYITFSRTVAKSGQFCGSELKAVCEPCPEYVPNCDFCGFSHKSHHLSTAPRIPFHQRLWLSALDAVCFPSQGSTQYRSIDERALEDHGHEDMVCSLAWACVWV